MKKEEIIVKLKKSLPKNIKSAIYSEIINEILILIRNLVESDGRYDFSIIKFYCDWILHPKKDYTPPKMKSLFQEALKNEGSFVRRFLEARDLHSEFEKFFAVFKLPKILINDAIFWQCLKGEIFTKVVNRPILKPIPEIAEVRFYDCKGSCLFFAIRYSKKKKFDVWPVIQFWEIKNKIMENKNLLEKLQRELEKVEKVKEEKGDPALETIYNYIQAEIKLLETAKPLESLPQLKERANELGYKFCNFEEWWEEHSEK